MEIAQRKVSEWIELNNTEEILDLSGLGLEVLPNLPDNLKYLDCSKNRLTSLPKLPKKLEKLGCGNNRLESLPKLPSKLSILVCIENKLTSLPKLPGTLLELGCQINELTSLPKLPDSLIGLNCSNNQLTSLELPSKLEKLGCGENPLKSLPELPDTLIDLYCENNKLTSLPKLPDNLTYLNCWDNELTALPHLPDTLTELNCSFNKLTSLQKLPNKLTKLLCNNNQLTSLPKLPSKLSILNCLKNELSVLPHLPDTLTELNCSNNQLTSLPKLPRTLILLFCGINQLTRLPYLPDTLTLLLCNDNQLISLPKLPLNLQELYCYNNKLIKLPDLPETLVTLNCRNNQLKSIPNLHENLELLNCSNNQLVSLPNLPNSLKKIDYDNNKFTKSELDSCDLLTENGDRCGDMSVMIKTVNDKCKHYCIKHLNKIIIDLRKRYLTVTVNDIKCNIKNINSITVNKKNIDISDEELLREIVHADISIKIKCDKILISPVKTIGWGDNLERWITSDWKINGDLLITELKLDYTEDEEIDKSMICKDIEYKTESLLGKGAFGSVNLVKYFGSEESAVVKDVIYTSDGIIYDRNIKELCFLSQYSHPNISKLKCVEYPNSNNPDHFKFHLENAGVSFDHLVKVFRENVDDSLSKVSTSNPSLNKVLENIYYVIYQLLNLFRDMAELNIIHGDLKPDNIAINQDLKVTVIDWGSVCLIPKYKYQEINGTLIFMSPEGRYSDTKFIGQINDIWSLGLSILFLYKKSYGFLDDIANEEKSVFDKFKEDKMYVNIKDNKIKKLLKRMLNPDYKERASADKLLESSIFDEYRYIPRTKFNIKELVLNKPDYNIDIKRRTMLIKLIYEYCEKNSIYGVFTLSCQLIDKLLNYVSKGDKLNEITTNKKFLCCFYIGCLMSMDFIYEIENIFTIYAKYYKEKNMVDYMSESLLEILKECNFIVYREPFDLTIDNPDYEIILDMMLDPKNIGLTNEEYLKVYNSKL